jgi:hypothetical protein
MFGKNFLFTKIIAVLMFALLVGAFYFKFSNEDDWICENGQWIKHGNTDSAMPQSECGSPAVSSSASPTADENSKSDLIRVTKPAPGEVIISPFTIEGMARGYWFFEASFPVEVRKENGEVIAVAIAEAQSDWMTEEFVPFKATVDFSASGGNGLLVFKKDNPSGLPENDNSFSVPVVFAPSETMLVKIYFGNSKLDPGVSCNKVFPVSRNVPGTQSVARAALEELLKGVSESEKKEGYFSSLPEGVKLQKITIDDGIARADFSDKLEHQIGGSCRVTAIRAEITETLKQFSSVKEVVISIDGRTEDILQP